MNAPDSLKALSRAQLEARYEAFCARGLRLDMSRGKPSPEQLDLSAALLEAPPSFVCEDGADARNYGDPAGIPEARRLFGALLGAPMEQVIVGGNSSLNLLCDVLTRAVLHGPLPGDAPWGSLGRVRILCPVPGYDWHFEMLRMLHLEPVPVPLLDDGPDMDAVEALALERGVKGLLCVPMYANPSGVTYSDAVVERLAAMPTAEADFRLFWDDAYCVHHLYPEDSPEGRDRLSNILTACARHDHVNRPIAFTSTSKITYAGSGVAAMAASPANIKRQLELMTYQLVCYDKVSQLLHVRFLKDADGVEAHMRRQALLLRPRFERVQRALQASVDDIAHWSRPRGGYFICFYAPPGCAKRIVELCARAGLTLTPAGAPFPGGIDPEDRVIRIAPTYPSLAELEQAMELFPIAVRLAKAELDEEEGR